MKKMNKHSKQRMLAGIALVIVVLLVASGVFVYYQYYREEEPVEEEHVIVIDDKISPMENQGLILEVLRIRHRGLYDKLMTPGTAWKNKPSFYFVAELDGLEYKSKDVESLGASTEILFRTWDSMFMENKIVRDAEEEQETSTVKIAVVERVDVKKGLFRKTKQDIERDRLTVIYDYRTGKWSSDDDSFRDYDGYGHYLGQTFEIWFNIYQMDYDRDYIPYWTEVNVLHTDPRVDDSNKDPDGDGIPTTWEWRWGYDPNIWDDHEKLDPDIDGIENIEEYKMAKWLADPYSQDIYIEVDYMGRGGRFDPPHVYYPESAQAITEMYAEHNIKMYWDLGWPDTPINGGGEVLQHYNFFSQDSGMILQYYEHHFPEERRGIFRYLVAGHGGPFNHPAVGNVYDCVFVGYDVTPRHLLKRMFVRKILPTQRNIIIMVAQTSMHELGHSVGIHPWSFEGCDNLSFSTSVQTWTKNYISLMNYAHIYDKNFLDYSHGTNGPPYDQNDWEKLWVANFEYNSVQIEEIYFKPPSLEKIVYAETPAGITGYEYDKNLTEQFVKNIRDWSPVNPIKVNFLAFKLKDKEKYPNYKEVKILVQPDVPEAWWSLYAEGNLDSEGNIQIYSQQDIIDNIMLELK